MPRYAGSIVMDAVYEPLRTRLLRDAEARGARSVSGKWMLIHQAAEQVRLLTGWEAPLAALIQGFDSVAESG
jgi:shikimate dehydrogenase